MLLFGSKAGDRLLIRGSNHKQVKQQQSILNKEAKGVGITLRWRFGREVYVKEWHVYVHPEWIIQPYQEVEYLAWALVVGVERKLTQLEKEQAIVKSVIGQLRRLERETGSQPSWVWEWETS
jgi:hypothetical protein